MSTVIGIIYLGPLTLSHISALLDHHDSYMYPMYESWRRKEKVISYIVYLWHSVYAVSHVYSPLYSIYSCSNVVTKENCEDIRRNSEDTRSLRHTSPECDTSSHCKTILFRVSDGEIILRVIILKLSCL